MLHLARANRWLTMQSFAHYFLGLVHYEWNELAAAERHFAVLLDHRHAATMIVVRDGMAQLALVHQVRGNAAEARQTLDLLSELELEQNGRENATTRALRAGLRLLQGDLAGAARWADAFDQPVQDQPLLWLANPQLTKALILFARQGARPTWRRRDQILDSLCAIAERTHNTRFTDPDPGHAGAGPRPATRPRRGRGGTESGGRTGQARRLCARVCGFGAAHAGTAGAPGAARRRRTAPVRRVCGGTRRPPKLPTAAHRLRPNTWCCPLRRSWPTC